MQLIYFNGTAIAALKKLNYSHPQLLSNNLAFYSEELQALFFAISTLKLVAHF